MTHIIKLQKQIRLYIYSLAMTNTETIVYYVKITLASLHWLLGNQLQLLFYKLIYFILDQTLTQMKHNNYYAIWLSGWWGEKLVKSWFWKMFAFLKQQSLIILFHQTLVFPSLWWTVNRIYIETDYNSSVKWLFNVILVSWSFYMGPTWRYTLNELCDRMLKSDSNSYSFTRTYQLQLFLTISTKHSKIELFQTTIMSEAALWPEGGWKKKRGRVTRRRPKVD